MGGSVNPVGINSYLRWGYLMSEKKVKDEISKILSNKANLWCKRAKNMERLGFREKYPKALDRAKYQCIYWRVLRDGFIRYCM